MFHIFTEQDSIMIKESGIVRKLRNLMEGAKKLYDDPSNNGDMWFFELFHALDEAATLIAELQAERDRIKAFLSEGSWATIESEQAWKRRALAAESSLHRVRETAWQPIETAPMDGTHIFVCDQSDPSFSFSQRPPTVAHWFGPPDLPGLRSGGWYLSVSYNEQPRLQGLTHWQHLPAPPAVADTNADAPGNVGLLGGVSTDQTSLNITGLDTGAVKTAESRNSPSTREE